MPENKLKEGDLVNFKASNANMKVPPLVVHKIISADTVDCMYYNTSTQEFVVVRMHSDALTKR